MPRFPTGPERGPVNPEDIKELLKPEVSQDSIDQFGKVWLFAVSKYWPDELYDDEELCQLLVAWEQDYLYCDYQPQPTDGLPEASRPVTGPSLAAAALPFAASGLTTAAEPDVLDFRNLR